MEHNCFPDDYPINVGKVFKTKDLCINMILQSTWSSK